MMPAPGAIKSRASTRAHAPRRRDSAGRAAAGDGRVRRPKTEGNLERLLSGAAAQMARRGFVKTSIRDVARETGFSLAGMYYYFRGKEELLYKIQDQTFSTLLREQEALAAGPGTPEEKLRRIVCNHLAFLTNHANELKVCTFELESLRGTYYRRIEALRRRYYKLVASLIGEVTGCPRDGGAGDGVVRHLTLFAFGMLNWVLMWFDRRRDQPTDELGGRMVDLLLGGLPRRRGAASRGRKARTAGRSAGGESPAGAKRRRGQRVEEGRS